MADEKEMGMLIDYGYCTGCHSCEVSCKQRFGLESDEWGIKVAELGPWKHGETDYEWNYIPMPTETCDLCADRRAAGKTPLCVLHCQSLVIEIGPVDELSKKMGDGKKKVLYNRTCEASRKEALF